MDIRVSGHQVDTGQALQQHVQDRILTITEKYFPNAISAHATFGKAPHQLFSCDIVAHMLQGLVVKGTGSAGDAHRAFDEAAEKIEKQVRRYKRRIQDRHAQTQFAIAQEDAAYRVLTAPPQDDEEVELAGDAPPVIAETSADIPTGSVSDAVMMLDLRDTDALLFKNAGTGRHNMVYRRRDGSIGWVEPAG